MRHERNSARHGEDEHRVEEDLEGGHPVRLCGRCWPCRKTVSTRAGIDALPPRPRRTTDPSPAAAGRRPGQPKAPARPSTLPAIEPIAQLARQASSRRSTQRYPQRSGGQVRARNADLPLRSIGGRREPTAKQLSGPDDMLERPVCGHRCAPAAIRSVGAGGWPRLRWRLSRRRRRKLERCTG